MKDNVSSNGLEKELEISLQENNELNNHNKTDFNNNYHTSIVSSGSSKITESFFKWGKFLSISFSIKKLFLSNSITEETPKKELIEHVDCLIDAKMYDSILTLIKNGYKTNSKQFKTLNHLFNHFIVRGDIINIEYWISHGWKISQDQVLHILFNEAMYKNNTNLLPLFSQRNKDNSYPYLSLTLKPLIDTNSFQLAYFKQWKKEMKNGFSSMPINIAHDNYLYLFRHIKTMNEFIQESNQYCQCVSIRAKRLTTERIFAKPSYLERLDNPGKLMTLIADVLFKKETNNIIENTKSVFSKERLTEISIQNVQQISQKINLNDLPEDAKTILDRLEIVYPQLLENMSLLSSQHQFDITNFMEVKIPEIINDYFSIPAKYREEFFNSSNHKPRDIIINALSNLESHINTIYLELVQQKVNTLSVKERYTQSFKKLT